MAVIVTLTDKSVITHPKAIKWIADPSGNLVIIEPPGTKASNIYASNSWTKAEVSA